MAWNASQCGNGAIGLMFSSHGFGGNGWEANRNFGGYPFFGYGQCGGIFFKTSLSQQQDSERCNSSSPSDSFWLATSPVSPVPPMPRIPFGYRAITKREPFHSEEKVSRDEGYGSNMSTETLGSWKDVKSGGVDGGKSFPMSADHGAKGNQASDRDLQPLPTSLTPPTNSGGLPLRIGFFNPRKGLMMRADRGRRQRCEFCVNNARWNNGSKALDPNVANHRCKDPESGAITCPVLRKTVCPECKATGDRAHTIRYCPVKKARELNAKLLAKKVCF